MLSQQLQVFLQVAESGSFSKAAEQRFVTPASVMKHINTLEARLGVKLFQRSSQGVALTPAGAALYADGKRLLALAESAAFRVRSAAQEERVLLRLGSSLRNPSTVLTDLWRPVQDRYRQYQFTILPYDDTEEQLLSAAAALGERVDLLVGAFSAQKLLSLANFFPLGTYPLCVAAPKGHRLADKDSLQIQDLYGERLMIRKGSTAPPIHRVRALLQRDHPQITIVDTDSFYDINIYNRCEQEGALLLTLKTWAALHPLLCTRPVDWPYHVPYGILYAKAPSPAVAGFLDILRQLSPPGAAAT